MPNALEQRIIDRLLAVAREAGVPIPAEVASIKAHLDEGRMGTAGWEGWLKLHPDADPDDPDPLGGCCYGVAVYGPHRCTCWVEVYDVEQTDPIVPVADGSIDTRRSRCGDCAFRRGSPERSDALHEEELLNLAAEGTPFWCHDGMRRPAWYEHPKLGRVPASGDDWRPPIVAGVPFRRDGRPGLLCAGWAQELRRQDRAT